MKIQDCYSPSPTDEVHPINNQFPFGDNRINENQDLSTYLVQTGTAIATNIFEFQIRDRATLYFTTINLSASAVRENKLHLGKKTL